MGLFVWWVIVILAIATAVAAAWGLSRRRRQLHGRHRQADDATTHAPPVQSIDPAQTDDAAEETAISLVLLLREPRELDQRTMARHIRNAWGIAIDVDDPDARQFVVCVAPGAMIQIDGVNFLVHNWPRPYVDDPAAAAASPGRGPTGDRRLSEAMAAHRAWLSVDLLRQSSQLSPQRIYQLIGRLIAELADANTLAVYVPKTHRLLPFDETTRRTLRSDDVLAALNGETSSIAGPKTESPPQPATPAGTLTAHGDERMAAAVAEARRRWPEFVEAFEQRDGEEHFAVKMPFSEADRSEYLWIEVSAIENDVVYGKLGNKPVHVRRLNEGDAVRAKIADLHDWAYVKNGKSHGLFTMQIAHEAHRRPPAEEED